LGIRDRLSQAWNAFSNRDQVEATVTFPYMGNSSSYQPHRTRTTYSTERSIVSSIYTRIGNDVAAIDLRHVTVDDLDRYVEDQKSKLQNALQIEPNLDQGPRAFRLDIVQTLFENGVAAIVPIDTTLDPNTNEFFDIFSMRVGRVVQWYPEKVRVEVYNETKGIREELILSKRYVALVENPFFQVMNEPNSTLNRLRAKLSLLDLVDDRSSSGKLDIIIQLPFIVKSQLQEDRAEKRRAAIEQQLKGSQFGIAYTDGQEKITQLNRPIENNLLKQVEYLTEQFYAQMGITAGVMDGSADEKTMVNYYNRTVEPILEAIAEAMNRTFLGPVGIRKKERIRYFRDPFKLVSVADMAEIGDKFIRNEILTKNELRGYLGIPPSTDPKADELRNPNMPDPAAAPAPTGATQPPTSDGVDVNAVLDEIDAEVSSAFESFGGATDA
jgi:hypothetical protein